MINVAIIHIQVYCANKVVVLYHSPLDVFTVITEYSWSISHPCCCCLDIAIRLHEGMCIQHYYMSSAMLLHACMIIIRTPSDTGYINSTVHIVTCRFLVYHNDSEYHAGLDHL